MTAQEIKEVRKGLGLSQKKLAQGLGIHWRTLQDWESGAWSPNGAAVALLHHLSHCSKLRNEVLRRSKKAPKDLSGIKGSVCP